MPLDLEALEFPLSSADTLELIAEAKRLQKLAGAAQAELGTMGVMRTRAESALLRALAKAPEWVDGQCIECDRWQAVGHRRSCSKFKAKP